MDKEEDVKATNPLRGRARNCAFEVGGKVFAGLAEICRDVEPTRRWMLVLMKTRHGHGRRMALDQRLK